MDRRQVKKNVLLSIAAQIISFGVGFILNLVAPKFISEYAYANWQTYALYASYVGILHFGLLDGIVLRYSQYDYEQLNKPILRSQFKMLLSITSIIALFFSIYSISVTKRDNRIIILLVSLAIIEKNIYTYTSYTFQMTNRINRYATLVISNRIIYGILVIAILLSGHHDFYLFCFADILSDCIGTILGMYYNRGLYLGKSISFKDTLSESWLNISSGFMLLTANWSAMFLISSSKMVIQWRWDEIVFAKTAFAFSLSNLFLQFMNAASIVLFPSLKRMDKKELPAIYKSIRETISPILFLVMILYFPGTFLLVRWIPRYSVSLKYLGIILPIIVFSSKVSLLTNNYFKSYRKEKQMLLINIITVLIGIGLYLFGAYALNEITAVLFFVVFAIMLRSVVSEIIISKLVDIKIYKDIIIELSMTVIFIISSFYIEGIKGFLVYLFCCLIYFFVYRKEITKHYFKKM